MCDGDKSPKHRVSRLEAGHRQVCPGKRTTVWCVVLKAYGWWVCRKSGNEAPTKWLAGPFPTKVEAVEALRKVKEAGK